MLDAQAIAEVEAMDEWERLRLWWHWMIDRYTDNAKYHPSVRMRNNVSLADFFRQDYPSVNGPKWTASTAYHQYAQPC